MLKPFRFWCNKILPLVYDDSLSYYELLCKVVEYLNKVVDQTNQNTDYINTLAGMIENFFKSPELREIIEEKLDEMAENGTLDSIINQPKMFVPNDESLYSYKNGILNKIAEWLYYEKNSKCVLLNPGESAPVIKYKPVYNTSGKNWQSLLGKDDIYVEDFVYTDTDGTDPIVYMNCTGFVNMITRARGYLDSPNYLASSGQISGDAALRNACMERGYPMQYSWTMDFLNWLHTYNMFYVMEKSGCTPKAFYKNGVYDENVFETMETGDILFSGRNEPRYSNYYRYLHHCMIFVKDLKDLNECGHGKPCTFRAYPYEDDYPNGSSRGYVVHCSGAINGWDVIRIESVEHLLAWDWNTNSAYAPITYYASKPYSNALNSSKARRVLTGTITDANTIMFGYRNGQTFPTQNRFFAADNYWLMNNVDIKGNLITQSTPAADVVDLNNFSGVIGWTKNAVTAENIADLYKQNRGGAL